MSNESTSTTPDANAAALPEAVAGMIQLTDYDEIGEVLKSRKFLQGGHRIARQSMLKDTTFMIDGAEHLARRRILARLLDDNAVAGYRDRHLVPVVERCLAEEAAAHRGADGMVRTDLAPLIQVCLHRVAAALVGIDGLETAAATQRFIGQVRAITAGQTVDWSLDDKDAVLARGHAARDEFQREFFDPSLARRKARITAARSRGDSADASMSSSNRRAAVRSARISNRRYRSSRARARTRAASAARVSSNAASACSIAASIFPALYNSRAALVAS